VILGVATLLPLFIRARTTSASNACVNNLRQIQGGKDQWTLENQKTTNDTPTWDDLRVYIGRSGTTGAVLTCPDGGTYILGRVGELPRCSLGASFAGGKSHRITQ